MKDVVQVDKVHGEWHPRHIYDKFDFRLKLVKNEEMLLVHDDIAKISAFFEKNGMKYVCEFEGDDVWFYLEEIGGLVTESFNEDSEITPMFDDFEQHVPGPEML